MPPPRPKVFVCIVNVFSWTIASSRSSRPVLEEDPAPVNFLTQITAGDGEIPEERTGRALLESESRGRGPSAQ